MWGTQSSGKATNPSSIVITLMSRHHTAKVDVDVGVRVGGRGGHTLEYISARCNILGRCSNVEC